ncbi:MAG: dTDP-4-dehydrorhamnose 3,5-epimerase family protein [Cyanobacteriota bacterium]
MQLEQGEHALHTASVVNHELSYGMQRVTPGRKRHHSGIGAHNPDVAVDIRRSSPTFGQWVAAELNAETQQQLWVPVGFAHGFLTLSDTAEVLYKASGYWCKSCERALRWNDPELGIPWPLDHLAGVAPMLADKDAAAPTLAKAVAAGEAFV